MTGVLLRILASGPARRALGCVLAGLTVLMFLLNLRRGGERAGRLGERLETMEKTHDAQRRMLEAATHRPRSRGELVERLRDGRF